MTSFEWSNKCAKKTESLKLNNTLKSIENTKGMRISSKSQGASLSVYFTMCKGHGRHVVDYKDRDCGGGR